MKNTAILCLSVLSLLFLVGVAQAWQPNGVPICDLPEEQSQPSVAFDGRGGAIFQWCDGRTWPSTDFNAYIQRVDQNGNPLWTADGVRLCSVNSFQPCTPGHSVLSDGQGGAIGVWSDYRSSNFDIYAQRVDSLGNILWTISGVLICTASGSQIWPVILSDGAGGAIIVWFDDRAGGIYAQRINANGLPLWTPNGVQAAASPALPYRGDAPRVPLAVTSDGRGGFVVAWQDHRNSSSNADVYAQRVSANGNVLWTPSGNPVCTAADNQWWVSLTNAGNIRATIVWTDRRTGGFEIYAQQLDSTGVPRWTMNGVSVRSATDTTGGTFYPRAVNDGSGGTIVAWMDQRYGQYVYAQKIDSAGNRQWTTSGTRLFNTPYPSQGAQGIASAISDATGGAIITTWIGRYPSPSGTEDVYSQRINPNGNLLWSTQGLVICNAGNDQFEPHAVLTETGHAIIVWEDYRNQGSNDMDIYAQSTKYLTSHIGGNEKATGFEAKNLLLNIQNPVRGKLVLSYTLSRTEIVCLELYDALGCKVKTIFEGPVVKGSHNLKTALNIPAGVYFLRLRTGRGEIVNKLAVIR